MSRRERESVRPHQKKKGVEGQRSRKKTAKQRSVSHGGPGRIAARETGMGDSFEVLANQRIFVSLL